MFEGLQIALDFLKKEGMTELFADFELDNMRSIEILQKLGFTDSKPGQMKVRFV